MAYRYELERRWTPPIDGSNVTALFVMLNPSIADEHADDPTIRKCCGFARQWGLAGIRVINLYAYRATKPANLWKAMYPVGDANDGIIRLHLDAAYQAGSPVVVAWGAHAKLDRVRRFVDLLNGRPALCLGTTKSGQPRHPLMVPYDTPLEPWTGP